MSLAYLRHPTTDDADEVSKKFVRRSAGGILPIKLTSVKASARHTRIIRICQYYIWDTLNINKGGPEVKRDRAMSLVENELEVERKQLLNAVYELYEDQAEGSNALDQFEADLERLASAYERTEELR